MMRFFRPQALAAFALVCALPAHAGADDALHVRGLAATCANCHGTDGRAVTESMPALAGRPADELLRKLRDLREGRAPSTIMRQLAAGYTDAQLESLARYFAAQPANKTGRAP